MAISKELFDNSGYASSNPSEYDLTIVARPSLENISKVGTWNIGKEIGRGRWGTVVEAYRDGDPPRVLKAYSGFYPETLFKREVGIQGQMEHPHVAPLVDSDRAEIAVDPITGPIEVLYSVMGHATEGSLHSVVSRRGAMQPAAVGQITSQTASALSAMHEKGFVHRDVKPDNLLVPAKGTVWLSDFGFAEEYPYQDTGRTLGGTHQFFAPEQFTGEANPSTDTHALALTALYLLTHESLWGNMSFQDHAAIAGETEIYEAYVHGKIDELRYPDLRRSFRRALSIFPSERPETPNDFANEFLSQVA